MAPPPRPAIYVASKMRRAGALRGSLGGRFNLVSSWLRDGPALGETDLRAVWGRNEAEIGAADMLVLHVYETDILRGALVEAGIALGLGVPVYQVGSCPALRQADGGAATFTCHRRWFQAATVDAAVDLWWRDFGPAGNEERTEAAG